MNTTVLAIKKSVVMLFSFALIATFLTLINVGVNETGNSALSTATVAQAASTPVITLTGGASSSTLTTPTVACAGAACTPRYTQNPPPAGAAVVNPRVRGVFYGCASVGSGGICNISNVVTRDTFIREPYQSCELSVGGSVVTIGGQAAVLYMRSRLGPIWNGANVEERMYANLTGMDLGWAPYPINWSAVNAQNYNGTRADVTEGPYRFRCVTKYRIKAQAYSTKSASCGLATDGRAFPYAVGYYVSYYNSDPAIHGGVPNRDWNITAATCAYQSPSQPPAKIATQLVTCYYNLSHSGWYSTNRAAIAAGGARTSNPPTYLGTYPQKPYISGKNSTARVNNCTNNLSLNASLNLSNGYAYYRLQGNATFQKYQYYIWDTAYTGGRQLTADIRPAGYGPISGVVYGVNVCRNGTPNTWQQYGSFGALPAGVNFSYSSCKRNVTWQCKIPNPPRINGVANNVQVMRDGNYLPTNLGGVIISGSGVRDISGAAAVQDRNTSYLVKVVNGSSPFNGTNANDSKQYFELWKGDKKTKTQWGAWISQPNANKNSYLNYYWSSDNGASWRMTYQAKINTAQFGVPWQATSKSAPTTMWKVETNVDCDGVKTSNAATVLRSVSTEG